MKNLVCTGAVLKCSFGQAPAVLNAMPAGLFICGRPAATISDMVPLLNVASFGLCSCTANPAVAAATAAAFGAPTPAPCLPAPAGSWQSPTPKVKAAGRPVLTDGSKLACIWGGQITVQFAGQSGMKG